MSKKLFTSILLCLIGFGAFFGSLNVRDTIIYSNTVSAAVESSPIPSWDIAKPGSTSNEIEKLYASVAEWMNIILGLISIIVSPAVMFAGWLMSPDWTSGDLFGLRAVFYQLWITVSNITYFIYAVMLIFIALATIFGSDHYGYKALLPKLALGILLVPFTWWAVQFIISTATIVTASVMSIPHETLNELQSSNTQQDSWWNKPSIPTKIEVSSDEKLTKKSEDATKECTESTCISPKKFLASSAGMYGYMMVYAYWVFQINEVKHINTGTDALQTLGWLLNQSIIAALMFLIFWILTLALIFMLLTRAMMLWVYTIFSPFLTLDIVLWGSLLKDVSKDFSIGQFIGLAFVPAIIGLSLSFWLVIIASITWGKAVSDGAVKCNQSMLENGWCKIVGIMWNPKNKIVRSVIGKWYSEKQSYPDFLSGPDVSGNTDVSSKDIVQKSNSTLETRNIVSIWGIDLIFRGSIRATDIDSYAKSANDTMSIIGAGGGIFGTIIVDIIALLFIWMAFMAAKTVNRVVSAAAAPFEDLGKKVWGMAASAPKYMPLPIPGGSIAGATKWIDALEWVKSQMADKKFKESGFWKFVQWMNQESQITEEQQHELNKALGNINTDTWIKGLIALKKDLTGPQNIYNQEVRRVMWKALGNKAEFGRTIRNDSNLSESTKRKIEEVLASNLNNDDQDLLITALIKWYDPSRIKTGALKDGLSGARSHLSTSGGGWSSSNSSSSSGWSTIEISAPKDSPIAIRVWSGKAFTIPVGDNKIEASKLDEWTKKALKWMNKNDFYNKLVMNQVDPDRANKIIESIEKLFQE
jgi:hypothetical protein